MNDEELKVEELSEAVAKRLGWYRKDQTIGDYRWSWVNPDGDVGLGHLDFLKLENAIKLMEREEWEEPPSLTLDTGWKPDTPWECSSDVYKANIVEYGKTPAEAICRAFLLITESE